MQSFKRIAGVVFFLCLSGAAPAQDPVFKVGMLSGGDEDNKFWGKMSVFAQAVAEDLNIDLQIAYPVQTSYTIKREGKALIDSMDQGDYFITAYYDAVSDDLLKATEIRDIRTFIINTAIYERDRKAVGSPRGKYSHWIGHIRPDDVMAGYLVADELLKHFDQPDNVYMIGLSGDRSVQAAFDRDTGLEQRLDESPEATLTGMEMSGWEAELARTATERLLEKHPETNAVWAASDSMALGSIETLKALGREPGRDIVVAGVDWTPAGLNAVQAGDMLATVGGHFMEAGIALMLIYDYHHGRDFVDEKGLSFKTSMYSVNRDNIDEYLEKVGDKPDWSSIDFKQLTKTHNPDLSSYDFSWSAISQQLQ